MFASGKKQQEKRETQDGIRNIEKGIGREMSVPRVLTKVDPLGGDRRKLRVV